tara:strand:- start:21 stop:2567 length:2547 start_codon:yes stop_codon:yes gene_type:complete
MRRIGTPGPITPTVVGGGGGAASITGTASGAIEKGDPVAFHSVGGVAKMILAKDYTGVGVVGKACNTHADNTIIDANGFGNYANMGKVADNKYVHWNYLSGLAIVTDNADGTMTQSSRYSEGAPSYFTGNFALKPISATAFVLLTGKTAGISFRICTVSGTVITVGAETNVTSGGGPNVKPLEIYPMGNGAKFVIVYRRSSTNRVALLTYTWSGTTPTLQDTTICSTLENTLFHYKMDEEKLLLFSNSMTGTTYGVSGFVYANDTEYTPTEHYVSSTQSLTSQSNKAVHVSATVIVNGQVNTDAHRWEYLGTGSPTVTTYAGAAVGFPTYVHVSGMQHHITTSLGHAVVVDVTGDTNLNHLEWNDTTHVLTTTTQFFLGTTAQQNYGILLERTAGNYVFIGKSNTSGNWAHVWFTISGSSIVDAFTSFGAGLSSVISSGSYNNIALMGGDLILIGYQTSTTEIKVETVQTDFITGYFQTYDSVPVTLTAVSGQIKLLPIGPKNAVLFYNDNSVYKMREVTLDASNNITLGTVYTVTPSNISVTFWKHTDTQFLITEAIAGGVVKIWLFDLTSGVITEKGSQTLSYANPTYRQANLMTDRVNNRVWFLETNYPTTKIGKVDFTDAGVFSNYTNIELSSTYVDSGIFPSITSCSEFSAMFTFTDTTAGIRSVWSRSAYINPASLASITLGTHSSLSHDDGANVESWQYPMVRTVDGWMGRDGQYNAIIIQKNRFRTVLRIFKTSVASHNIEWQTMSLGAGRLYAAPSTGTTLPQSGFSGEFRNCVIGVADADYTDGQIVTAIPIGSVADAYTSLEIGHEYYIQSDGTITVLQTDFPLGLAISTTEIMLKI